MLLYWVLALLCAGAARGDLSSQLHRYETLKAAAVEGTSRARRSVDVSSRYSGRVQHVKFDAFGEEYKLTLTSLPTGELLSPHFKAEIIDADGHKEYIPVDPTDFYHGAVDGEVGSQVRAHWEGRALSATVKSRRGTLHIEPKYVHDRDAEDGDMIVYRDSDVKREENPVGQFCESINPEKAYNISSEEEEEGPTLKYSVPNDRQRRQSSYSPSRLKCTLLLVADKKFFDTVCGGGGRERESWCVQYLIGAADRVNAIYNETQWHLDTNTVQQGYSFEIKKIKVYSSFSRGFNAAKNWGTSDLLEAFSSDKELSRDMDSVCLAHLFTAQQFSTGTLGLAYIASPRRGGVGGICSPGYSKSYKVYLHLNTGWSSATDKSGTTLIRDQLDLVTAHELGHNWGSEHDPDTDKCSPSADEGGKFIMYTYSVTGYDSNNKLFSSCSRRSIGLVLKYRADRCFVEPTGKFCGNSLREEDEECDVGALRPEDADMCCTHECKFKPGMVCSDKNDVCCTNQCQFAPRKTECSPENRLTCTGRSLCSGFSAKCSDPVPLADTNVKCNDNGTCKVREGKDVCVPYCEATHGRKDCICDGDNSCRRCCRRGLDESTPCEPFNPTDARFNLPAGRPCVSGSCDAEGKCEKEEGNLVERLWDVIVHLDKSTLIAFMRANIVGVVIVLSLLIWIPVSCAVHYIDKKKEKKEKDERDWHRRTDSRLVLPDDRDRVRAANLTRGVPETTRERLGMLVDRNMFQIMQRRQREETPI